MEVPCWWNGDGNSLKSTIAFYRPDLFPELTTNQNNFISLNPPEVRDIPGVGELMFASFPVQNNFSDSIKTNSWWMGEKYDGIRFCYVPAMDSIYTRNGNILPLLPAFYETFPSIFLDGELWFGRGLYNKSHLLLSQNAADFRDWDFVRLNIFDVPNIEVHKKLFEKRYRILVSSLAIDSPSLITKEIIKEGGEGTILRAIRSFYENGRSRSLMKIKASFGDKEGLVVGIGEDKSVVIKLPNEDTFTVPPEDVKIDTPHIGSVVTFSYENYSKRLSPVSPCLYRVRSDLSWDDVLYQASQDEIVTIAEGHTQAYGHWTKERMRKKLEEFARDKGLDPNDPMSWYSLTAKDLKTENETTLKKLKGYKNAIKVLFPENIFANNEFTFASWEKVENRRQFFENYAKLNGFDPLIADNWYNQPMERIRAIKGAISLTYYHNNKIEQALVDLFPNIDLDLSQFWQSRPTWQNAKNRKLFFEKFAEKQNFDPLVPQNWYWVTKSQILNEKGGNLVLARHNKSLSKALLSLFPNIGLDPLQFRGANSWSDEKDRREFFILYAKVNKFDPEVAENWYKQPREKIMSAKGAYNVIGYHKGTVPTALAELFPHLNWELQKFFPRASPKCIAGTI